MREYFQGISTCGVRIDFSASSCREIWWHALRAIIGGMVRPKRVSGLLQSEVESICMLIATCFLEGLEWRDRQRAYLRSKLTSTQGSTQTGFVFQEMNVHRSGWGITSTSPRLLGIPGAPAAASELVQGMLLLERVHVPPASQRLSIRTDCASCIVLFSVPLEEGSDASWETLSTLVDALCSWANVVGCQQGMSQRVLGKLMQHSVLPLERLSLAIIQVTALLPSCADACRLGFL